MVDKRKKTKENFLNNVKGLYGDRYDYSKVVYVDLMTPVSVVCHEHGEFEILPKNYLRGQKCSSCTSEEKTRDFVSEAQAIYGDLYDYSKVVYTKSNETVTIICREHGEFQKYPYAHLKRGQGCRKCGYIQGGVKRTGRKKSQDELNKRFETNRKRYGAKTWAQSKEGRRRLHEIVTSEEVSSKMRKTNEERYGAFNWAQSKVGRESLKVLMNDPDMKKKIKKGYLRNYGVDHYMKTGEGRDKARSYMTEERQEKIKQVFYERYGVYSFFESDDFKKKTKETLKKRYGVEFPWQIPGVLEKIAATKRKNGTFNTSKPEMTMGALLVDVFGEDDVFKQYKSDKYPFNCDFYIKSLDLYIELNASWTHGGHWFDDQNEDDLAQLADWKKRAKSKGSKMYYSAIDTWTRRDLLKRQTAIDNNLNYLVFWDNDLSDFRQWLFDQHLLD